MIDAALERAKKSLQICDVYLRHGSMTVSDSYDHRSGPGEAISRQYRHIVEKSEMLVADDGVSAKRYFRVHILLGYRWGVDQAAGDDVQTDTGDPTDQQKADRFHELGRIEGKYITEYEITEELPQDCLDTFALKNASFHVWPFWREFVASSCMRLNAPKQILPTIQLAQNQCDPDAAKSDGP